MARCPYTDCLYHGHPEFIDKCADCVRNPDHRPNAIDHYEYGGPALYCPFCGRKMKLVINRKPLEEVWECPEHGLMRFHGECPCWELTSYSE